MPKPPRYLKQLEHELLVSAMMRCSGGTRWFIAGLLMPRIDQTERMAACRLGKRGEDEPVFDSLDHLNPVLGL